MSDCEGPQRRGRDSYRPSIGVMPSARRSISNTSRASIGSVGRRSIGSSSAERRPLHQPKHVATKYVSAKEKADQRAREQLIKARKNRRVEEVYREKRRMPTARSPPAQRNQFEQWHQPSQQQQQQQQPPQPEQSTPAAATKPFSLLGITYSSLIESMSKFIKAPVEEPVPESRETRLATLRDRRKREKLQPAEEPPSEPAAPEPEVDDLDDLPCDEDFAPPAVLPRKSLQDRRLERQRQKAKAPDTSQMDDQSSRYDFLLQQTKRPRYSVSARPSDDNSEDEKDDKDSAE